MKPISENVKEMLKWTSSGNTITDYFLKEGWNLIDFWRLKNEIR